MLAQSRISFAAVLIAALCSLTLLPFVAHEVSAQATGTWNLEVPGFAEPINAAILDSTNEHVGLAVIGNNTGKVAFFTRDNGTWTPRSQNITGLDIAGSIDMKSMGGTRWIIAVMNYTSTTGDTYIYTTSNDGVSWTKNATISFCTSACYNQYNDAPSLSWNQFGGTVFLTQIFRKGDVNGRVSLYRSDDYGASWINRLQSSQPALTTANSAGSCVASIGNQIWVDFANGDSLYELFSDDGGNFWNNITNTAQRVFQSDQGGTTFTGRCRQAIDYNFTTGAMQRISATNYRLTNANTFTSGANGWAWNTSFPINPGGNVRTFDPTNGNHSVVIPSPNIAISSSLVQVMAIANTTTQIFTRCNTTAWVSVFSMQVNPVNTLTTGATPTTGYVAYSNSSLGGRLEVRAANITSCPVPPPPSTLPTFNAYAPISFAGLKGFDVDDNGDIVIIRNSTNVNGTNDQVRVFTATNLSPGNSQPTNCPFSDGVSAQRIPNRQADFVLFQNCNAIQIWLRSGSLAVPPFDTDCGSGNFCPQDLNDTEFDGTHDDPFEMIDLSDVSIVPYDFQKNCIAGCAPNVAHLAFAFGTQFGRYGVVIYNAVNNADDVTHSTTLELNSDSSAIQDICTSTDQRTSDAYLYARGTGGVVGVVVSFTHLDSTTSLGQQSADPVLTSHWSLSGYNNATAIGCGGDYLEIVQPTSVSLFDTNGGSGLPIIVATGTQIGGLTAATCDPKGEICGYLDNTQSVMRLYYAANATTGNITYVGNFSVPTNGTIVDFQLDNDAKHAWIALNNGVAEYDVCIVYTHFFCATNGLGNDQDHDGTIDSQDSDMDGDGLPNITDPDIDGDGLCNGATPTSPAITTNKTEAEANPGKGFGCVPGDLDNDNDNLNNTQDPTPGGATSGPGGSSSTSSTGTSTIGGGTLHLTGNVAIIVAIVVILAFAFIGYLFTVGRRKKEE